MDDTSKLSRLRGLETPTSIILSGGILPPLISNQITNVVQSIIGVSLKSFVLFIVRSTQPFDVTSLLPLVSIAFLSGMSSINMQNVSTSSQLIPQDTNIGTCSSSIPF
jgi:hypothetical protein